MTAPNEKRAACSKCLAHFDWNGRAVIELCPLHAAAPALSKALSDMVKAHFNMENLTPEMWLAAGCALEKAEGR